MKVVNNCSFAVKVFGWDVRIGHGVDVVIESGQCKEVTGPYLGEMGDGSCYVHIAGEISCH